jgi:hypothetical protein
LAPLHVAFVPWSLEVDVFAHAKLAEGGFGFFDFLLGGAAFRDDLGGGFQLWPFDGRELGQERAPRNLAQHRQGDWRVPHGPTSSRLAPLTQVWLSGF